MPVTFTETTTRTLYTFRELCELEGQPNGIDGKSVDRARTWLQEGVTDGDWDDYLLELWKGALDQVGFEDARIACSGFYCQGDGTSFEAVPDLYKLVKFLTTLWTPSDSVTSEDGVKEEFRPWVCKRIGRSGNEPKFREVLRWAESMQLSVERTDRRYCHENTCKFSAEMYQDFYKRRKRQEAAEALTLDFEQSVEALRRDLCQAIHESLQNEYEDLQEDESLIDYADGNDWLFDRHGNHFRRDYFEDAQEVQTEDKPAAKSAKVVRLQLQKRRLWRGEGQPARDDGGPAVCQVPNGD